MADTFTSGTGGKVRLASGTFTVAGIKKWTLRKTVNLVRIPHFESGADSDGVIHPKHLVGLGGPHTGSIEGYFNSDSTNKTDGSAAGLTVGASIIIDLILVRGTLLGFIGVVATVTQMTFDVAVENQPVSFTMEFESYGTPGKTSIGS